MKANIPITPLNQLIIIPCVFLLIVCIFVLICPLFATASEPNEVPQVPVIRPLNQQITQAPQDWKDAYGDTLETQIVYNLALLRHNDLTIAGAINKLHAKDPNEVKDSTVDPNEVKDGTTRWNYEGSGELEIYNDKKWIPIVPSPSPEMKSPETRLNKVDPNEVIDD